MKMKRMLEKIMNRVGIVAMLLATGAVWAQPSPVSQVSQYPDKPIRVILPFAAGQGSDTLTRMIMTEVSKKLAQPIVIENRPGGNGFIAIQAVQHAAPNGHTILGLSSSFLSNSSMLKGPLPYDMQRDFTPILRVADSAIVLVANPAVPVKTLADALEMARREPGGLAFGSGGNATTQHLSLEMLKARSGAPMVHVPYRGDPASLNDVMGGQLKFTFSGFSAALPYIRAGRLRPIAVTTATRIAALPDVPSIAESGFPGFELIGWIFYLVPAGTPQAVIDKLYTVIRGSIEKKEVEEKMANLAMFVAPIQTPPEFKSYINEYEQKLANIIKSANIKAE
ncbi:MAG: tripartite tricarboxylate transporter substrate binding protein [Betaproteobacteria bacterium]|nr:tripartite tricarboxylate transporter substrate binding protein [Betaproteobacteria bacterium]